MRMVRVQNIREGMELARDIPATAPGSPPLLRSGFQMHSRVVARLQEMNVRAVWVQDALAEGIAPVEPLPEAVRESARRASADCLEGARVALTSHRRLDPGIFDRVRDVVDDMTTVLMNCAPAACALDDLATADSYTHTHSVRVATLGIMLADHVMRSDGWTDWTGTVRTDRIRERLVDIGTGLLVHDIGKIAVPTEILNKPETLTPEEFDLIKTHPAAGLSLLEGADLSPLTLSVVRDHHERWDGEGYPLGKRGADLHLFPRIAPTVDTFDAVTADRPYKAATAPHVGVKVIRDGAASQFDPHIAERFCQVVMPYPVGHTLNLCDGAEVVVADVDPAHPTWPLLRYRDSSGQFVEQNLRVEDGIVHPESHGHAPETLATAASGPVSALG